MHFYLLESFTNRQQNTAVTWKASYLLQHHGSSANLLRNQFVSLYIWTTRSRGQLGLWICRSNSRSFTWFAQTWKVLEFRSLKWKVLIFTFFWKSAWKVLEKCKSDLKVLEKCLNFMSVRLVCHFKQKLRNKLERSMNLACLLPCASSVRIQGQITRVMLMVQIHLETIVFLFFFLSIFLYFFSFNVLCVCVCELTICSSNGLIQIFLNFYFKLEFISSPNM